jgi:S-layer protein
MAASQSSAIFPVITDAAAGDKIQFNAPAVSAVTNVGVFGSALTSNVNDYQTFLSAGSHLAAGQASWFQFGGDTYIMVETSGNGNFDAGTDTVVKLTGLHDLSLSTWAVSSGHNVLTIV